MTYLRETSMMLWHLVGEMSEQLIREARKLEVRLEDFVNENDELVREARGCLENLKELAGIMEETETVCDPAKKEELRQRRLAAVKALATVIKREGKTQHERSHLIESYADLVLVLGVD